MILSEQSIYNAKIFNPTTFSDQVFDNIQKSLKGEYINYNVYLNAEKKGYESYSGECFCEHTGPNAYYVPQTVIGKYASVKPECKHLLILKGKSNDYKLTATQTYQAVYGFLTALYSQSKVEKRFRVVYESNQEIFDDFVPWSDAIIIERGVENPNIRPICNASKKPVYFYDGYTAMYAELPIIRKTLEKQGLI